MKLSEAFKIKTGGTNVVLVGNPELSGYTSSEGEPYYKVKTKELIMVRCSTDSQIEAFETDEVYVRESDLEKDGWEFENVKKPELGFWQADWKVDFSKGQEIAMYQSETIRAWSKRNRTTRLDNDRQDINANIRKMIEERKKK